MKLLCVAAAAFLLSAGNVSAQQGGTPEEREACAPDVKKLCVPVIDQGDLAILGCLKQNRQKLSKACNQVLVNRGQ